MAFDLSDNQIVEVVVLENYTLDQERCAKKCRYGAPSFSRWILENEGRYINFFSSA
jgi:hypothetical protein